MPKWTHGADGERFPVTPGSIWQAGEHYVACGDVQAGDLARWVPRLPKVQLVCTDPPWNQTMAKSFRTRAGEKAHDANFNYLVQMFFTAIVPLAAPVCVVEMGTQHAEHISELMRDAMFGDYPNVEQTQVPYGRSTSVLVAGVRDLTQVRAWRAPPKERTSYAEIMRRWLLPGQVCLDPFCGLGLIPTAVARAGGISWSMDLHPNRVSRTLCALEKETGQTPRKVSYL
jgi:hypothetical protein